MKKKDAKKKNRIISFTCIGVFISALVLFSIVTTNIILTFIENQKLISQKEEMNNDLVHIGDVIEDVKDGYFVVYAENDYIIEQENGETIIIYKI